MNKVILCGNVGRDPEVKSTENSKIAKFSLATTEKYKGEEKTEWHNIIAWGSLAEIVAKYIRKGSKLLIDGKIQTKKYQEKYYTEILALSIQMLDSKPPTERLETPTGNAPGATSNDGDLPF